jgi:hypothetical protein
MNKTTIENQAAESFKELVKPLDRQTEKRFFEVENLCGEFAIPPNFNCGGYNKSISESEQDLLF